MLALYRAHRQADALAALRRARTTLSDELGVDPGPALRALEAEVLAQSPTLDAPARTVAPPAAAPAEPEPAPAAPPRTDRSAPVLAPVPSEEMVDRDREVQVMAGALADALDGQGRMLLIHGPAGIGKSRLLQEVRRTAAEKGALVLTARGSHLERDFGFGAVRQLFEGTVRRPGPPRHPARRGRVLGRGGLRRRDRPASTRTTRPTAPTARSPCCTASTGSPSTWRPSSRWCSRSMTSSGATPASVRALRSCSAGSRGCRC